MGTAPSAHPAALLSRRPGPRKAAPAVAAARLQGVICRKTRLLSTSRAFWGTEKGSWASGQRKHADAPHPPGTPEYESPRRRRVPCGLNDGRACVLRVTTMGSWSSSRQLVRVPGHLGPNNGRVTSACRRCACTRAWRLPRCWMIVHDKGARAAVPRAVLSVGPHGGLSARPTPPPAARVRGSPLGARPRPHGPGALGRAFSPPSPVLARLQDGNRGTRPRGTVALAGRRAAVGHAAT